jgi:Uma2 family endonuclease
MAMGPKSEEESFHGIPMTEEQFEQFIGIESPYRYELIDGIVYDMTGSTPEHGTIATNMLVLFREQLASGTPCRVYQDQYVAIPGKASCMPDVVLTCDLADWDKDKRLEPFKIRSPLVVVEVLSLSTRKNDRGEKFARYRRANGWQKEIFTVGQIILLDQLDLEFPVDEMYREVF